MSNISNVISPVLLKKDAETSELDLGKYTQGIKQFYNLRPILYWCDFLLSSFLGNLFIYFSVIAASFSVQQVFYISLSTIFLFRSALFVHEDSHFGSKIKGFTWGYNLIFGFLHKLPSYSYQPHRQHHAVNTYGTINDPEYDLIIDRPAFTLLLPFVSMALIPIFSLIRYGFIPLILPFIGDQGRSWVYIHISTLVMNLQFKRNLPTKEERKDWYIQDFFCCIYNTVLFVLMILGVLPWKLLWVWLAVMYVVYVINFYRVITSHTYLSRFNKTTFKQQILDSINIPSIFWSMWLYPVGLKYHALHHMYPNIPYHNLGKAHKWLISELPDKHPYRTTVSSSYFNAVGRLLVPYKK